MVSLLDEVRGLLGRRRDLPPDHPLLLLVVGQLALRRLAFEGERLGGIRVLVAHVSDLRGVLPLERVELVPNLARRPHQPFHLTLDQLRAALEDVLRDAHALERLALHLDLLVQLLERSVPPRPHAMGVMHGVDSVHETVLPLIALEVRVREVRVVVDHRLQVCVRGARVVQGSKVRRFTLELAIVMRGVRGEVAIELSLPRLPGRLRSLLQQRPRAARRM
mmetsp:Transcript_67956/g.162268  ORF Transcript_67956/g.162268 Transcript_67956/m.162268 type:complete len:221 (-) Transcript_67956:92-754(-)